MLFFSVDCIGLLADFIFSPAGRLSGSFSRRLAGNLITSLEASVFRGLSRTAEVLVISVRQILCLTRGAAQRLLHFPLHSQATAK